MKKVIMSDDAMVRWLRVCAQYFENRDTHGEDSYHWSNVYNARNAREVADRLEALVKQRCS